MTISNQNKTRLVVFLFGAVGVLSLLTNNIPLENIPAAVLEKISVTQLKYLSLINPMILLIVSVFIGGLTHKSLGLRVFSLYESERAELKSLIRTGLFGGILLCILVIVLNLLFRFIIPSELSILEKSNYASPLARILYGGFTEEILLRFGFMTLIVWIGHKITKSKSHYLYWIGIILSSALFALGHFPITFVILPNPSVIVLTYIFLGNFMGGIIFGWIYWKKGLDISFIAHIVFHLCVMALSILFSI